MARIAKYFWDLNKKALGETERILRNASHPKFTSRMVTFLSRCDNPKELFSLISKNDFIQSWPSIKSYWQRAERRSEFRDWWQTAYEQLLEKKGIKKTALKGEASSLFRGVGSVIKEARIKKGLSQKELSVLTRIKQPEISKIEDGKKNITLATLARFSRVLGISQVKIRIS